MTTCKQQMVVEEIPAELGLSNVENLRPLGLKVVADKIDEAKIADIL